MSYDNAIKQTYVFPSSAFGATTAATTFKGPPGKAGFVRDIRVEPSADFVGTTTVPEVDVGNASGDVTNARFRLGSTAILGYTAAGGPLNAASLVASAPGNTGGVPRALNDYAGHIALETARLAADTAFVITLKAGTGGVPAGTARVEVDIDWF